MKLPAALELKREWIKACALQQDIMVAVHWAESMAR